MTPINYYLVLFYHVGVFEMVCIESAHFYTCTSKSFGLTMLWVCNCCLFVDTIISLQ